MVMTDLLSVGKKRKSMSSKEKHYVQSGSSTSSKDTVNANLDSNGRRKLLDFSDPFQVPNILASLNEERYGSVTKEIEALLVRNIELIGPLFAAHPSLLDDFHREITSDIPHLEDNTIQLQDNRAASGVTLPIVPVIIIDSDDDDIVEPRPARNLHDIILPPKPEPVSPPKPTVAVPVAKDIPYNYDTEVRDAVITTLKQEVAFPSKTNVEKDKGVYVGVEEDDSDEAEAEAEDDGLGDIWKEMAFALEINKEDANPLDEEHMQVDGDCDHSFVLKDDIGYVCRVCGVIDRRIDTIIDLQFVKAKKSTRTYASDPWDDKDKASNAIGEIRFSDTEFTVAGISAHPRHRKEMKPHQVEGFNFLCSNLVSDQPGGCIMAHAPGSGKTFMIISFVQSFLAKYPHARPLVVLPKGILSTWKREFSKWQVEDTPLYDFYSTKAEKRFQQLEILKRWKENKSILFLGYQQFTSIFYDNVTNEASEACSCREILVKAPSLLILDEGHTSRNDNTEMFNTLAKVETPRKVVLSGTLFQNHVKEVFNILELVRPNFLRLDTSKMIIRRIMSRGDISDLRKRIKPGDHAPFFELVENTLQKDKDFTRKVKVIEDLREMTKSVLHYYKGDFLGELPGLNDFSVMLNLTPSQTAEVEKLKKKMKATRGSMFKQNSDGSLLYLHPALTSFADSQLLLTNERMDKLLSKIDVRAGVKAKFFLNMLNLCVSTNEKLLVFSQYLAPLKFLERLTVKEKGWALGVEIFMITGDSSADQREHSMDRFNNSADAKVFLGSIKACGEGISLVGASRIIILDVHLNPSVTRQAIGRAFRPGQKNEVFSYRLVAAESPEEDDHSLCFRKEAMSKMWFEWNEYCGYQNFDVLTVDLLESGDPFMDSQILREDIKAIYRRNGIENVGKSNQR